jgi:hypothetical protein
MPQRPEAIIANSGRVGTFGALLCWLRRDLKCSGVFMSDQTLAEIKSFFDEYINAFDIVDGAAIAKCYNAPSITMRGDASVHVFQNSQELEAFFHSLAQKYYDDGAKTSRYSDLTLQPIGSKSVLATMDWRQLRSDESVVRSWRQSYNLICPNGRWQILVSTFHI